MAQKLKIGLLGCGGIAQIAHLPALKKAANVDFTTICDAAEDLARHMAQKYDVPHVFTDHKKFLAEADIEAVLIPVAHAYHAPLSIDAMRAGKHVIVEKPMAVTVAECEEMVRVSRETGRQLQMACMKRYDPGVQFAQKFIAEEMGPRFAVSGWYCDSVFHGQYVSSLTPPRFSSKAQKRPASGLTDAHLNNLLGHGVHLLDTLRFLGGDVAAVTTTKTMKEKDLVTMSLLEWADGARGTFTLIVRLRMDWSEGFMVHGAGGSALGEVFFPYTLKPAAVRVFDAKRNEYRTPAMPDTDPYERQLEGFAAAILEGRPVSPNGEDGLKAQKILYAMQQSAETGRRVAVA
ncbi:MAG: Gfo/Idh/MocA family oxidoreductase [Planctomycetes bacterium]|nr:Gfo/Idh/MocA family oxidoreductase [Planctomycetota bacterium]